MVAARPVKLFESADGNSAARVDRDKGIIYGVKILGFQSRATGRTIGLDPNEFGPAIDEPYSYDPAAVAEAAPLYEGVRVYIDHPEFKYLPSGERIPSQRDRRLDEVFGRLVNIRVGETGLFGDLQYVTSHPDAPQIVELAEKFPELLALSHNAHGDPSLINGRIVITEIGDVKSVDIVGERPGTTQSLFESEPNQMAGEVGTPEAPEIGKNPDEKVTTQVNGGDASLHEDDPGVMPADAPPAATMENAPGGDPAPADHFDAAFQKEIMGIVSGDGTAQDKAGKIVALLKLQDKVGAVRGGGDEEPADVGSDLDETDPEPEAKPEDKKVLEAAPSDTPTDKKPVTETAPKVVTPSKSKLLTELLETVVIPCIDLANAHGVPVRGATISALCRTPSKRRRALVETLAEAPRARTAARSQPGAVGLAETSPRATQRPGTAASKTEPERAKPRMVDRSDDELLGYLRSGYLPAGK